MVSNESNGVADRSSFSTSWGTICSTAGVAIGLGNIWRFPYMMGKHGGVLFLMAYLAIAVAFGLPALMAEWSLARHTRSGPFCALHRAGLPGGRVVSIVMIFSVLMASSYYGLLVGWVLYFTAGFAVRSFGFGWSGSFDVLSHGVLLQSISLGCVSLISGSILYFGVRHGIEKVSRWGLPVFFVLIAVLVVRVLTLEGATNALGGYLVPRADHFKPTTPLAALGQVFFSFGLGGTFMVAYGSYMRSDESIPRVAIFTAGADVVAALLAGAIVIPAALVFGLPTEAGPSLMFDVMPAVFEKMTGGATFGLMFFGSVFLVALLSQMAAFEVVIDGLTHGFRWSRQRAVVVVAVASSLLAIPAMYIGGYVEMSDFIWGTTMQPLGAVFAVLAFAWCLHRGDALSQLRRNTSLPVPDWLFYWIKYGLPIGIVSTLLFEWVSHG